MNKRKIEQQIYKLVVEVYQDGYKNAITNQHEYGEQMYQKGLNDAWECARKIADQFEHDTDIENRVVIDDDILTTLESLTASEAIQKVKEYEEKKSPIKKTCENCAHPPYSCQECGLRKEN